MYVKSKPAHLTVTAKMILQLIFGLERYKRIAVKYCEVEDCHFYGKDNLCDARSMRWHGKDFVNNFDKASKKENIREAQLYIG